MITARRAPMDEYTTIMAHGGYKVLSKVIFRFTKGAEMIASVSTNEIDKPLNAFVDTLGRVVALGEQYVEEDTVYFTCEESAQEALKSYLEKYLKLAGVEAKHEWKRVVHVIGDHDIGDVKIPTRIGYITFIKDPKQLSLSEISDEVYEIIRIENNMPKHGVDFTNNMLLECGWDDAVSFDKGCFPGQEILCRVNTLGKPAKKMVRILYDSLPKEVTVDGKRIGDITTHCFSPKYNKCLAFALIKKYDQKIDGGELLNG